MQGIPELGKGQRLEDTGSLGGHRKSSTKGLLDILGLVAMQGQADIVARVGLGLTRGTWSDAYLWRACIDVIFGETKLSYDKFCYRLKVFESTARTRLMLYLERGRADLVERALSYGADPNLNTTFHMEDKMVTLRTPLMCTIEKKNLSLARLVLKHGANPNQVFQSDDGTVSDDGTAYEHIIQSSTSFSTPLELASIKGDLPMVRLLVDEYGVKIPGAFPPDQVVPIAKIPHCVPLQIAIRNNRLPLVRYFVETKGVRLNYPGLDEDLWNEEEQKWDAEDAEIDSNVISYFEDVFDSNSGVCLEIVSCILDAGAIFNYTIDSLASPLYMAASGKRMDIVAALLARGADPNLAGDFDHCTPILAAAEHNLPRMASALVAAGANVTASIRHDDGFDDFHGMQRDGMTALHFFARHGNSEGLRLMLSAGAEMDALTFLGLTPLLTVVKAVAETAADDDDDARIGAACACCPVMWTPKTRVGNQDS